MRTIGLLLLFAVFSPRVTWGQSAQSQHAIAAAATLRPATSTERMLAPPATDSLSNAVVAGRQFSSRAPGGTLMIVGGAMFLTGLFVDGDGGTVLVVGGVGLGAYGVYLFTR